MKSIDSLYSQHICVRTQSHKPHIWFKFFNYITGSKQYIVKRTYYGFLIFNHYDQIIATLKSNWAKTYYELFKNNHSIAVIKYSQKNQDIILMIKSKNIILANQKLPSNEQINFETKKYQKSCKNFKMQLLDGEASLEFIKVADTHYKLLYNTNIPQLVAISLIVTRFLI